MTRIMKTCALAILAGAMANAATTISTTLTVTNATISLATDTVSGPVTLTNIGSGTFSATVTLGATGITGSYTITVSGGTIFGAMTFPTTVLTGSGSGSATVTGGTGSYAGATGSFPSLSGSGSISSTTGTVTLSFSGSGTITTGGGGSTAPPPAITAVLDAGSYTANIAEGSVFVVKGTNLSASGLVEFGFPLPTSCTVALCAGAASGEITFTPASGGAGTQAYLVYLYNQSGVNQLAAVLPSGLAPGNYNVTVMNNGGSTSAPFPVTVVQRKIGLITADSSGSGLAVIQNYISATELDVDRFTTGSVGGFTISPAKPGQTLIAWATGMGPVTTGDNTASPGFNFEANGVNVQVIVGGVSITPLYAGRAPGLAGADQINFVLPSNVPTGCTVAFQVSVNGTLSNPAFISIAPNAGANACVQPGYTTSQLQSFDQGGTYKSGGFSITQFSETIPSLGSVEIAEGVGGFTEYTGFELASATASIATLGTSGSCQVVQITASQGQVSTGGGIALDAGNVTLTGPSGSNLNNTAFTETDNSYSLQIGEQGLPSSVGYGNGTLVAGTYTLTGAGGKDVGAFNASITIGSPLTITGGLPTVVTRGAGLTLNWTGGNPSDLVEIAGYTTTASGSGASSTQVGTEFICTTTAGQGTFTVPASILDQLPAVSAAAEANGTASGSLEVFSGGNPSSGNGLFTAQLTAGGSISSYFTALVGYAAQVVYQ
jgi:uncharacterized protein (TIGR03437 family)